MTDIEKAKKAVKGNDDAFDIIDLIKNGESTHFDEVYVQ